MAAGVHVLARHEVVHLEIPSELLNEILPGIALPPGIGFYISPVLSPYSRSVTCLVGGRGLLRPSAAEWHDIEQRQLRMFLPDVCQSRTHLVNPSVENEPYHDVFTSHCDFQHGTYTINLIVVGFQCTHFSQSRHEQLKNTRMQDSSTIIGQLSFDIPHHDQAMTFSLNYGHGR